ncbi:MAG TPA: methionyl-tRNA formyltransferase, partial [Bdellovibrionales bacterium]|nr:methionyl-tRNA formyltransferase [Bdellovibrionales bacterium]
VPCLERLLDVPAFEVAGVISQPDKPAGRSMKLQSSPVKQLAVERGLPVLTPESARAPEVLEWIRGVRADSAVVVAYGQILSRDFLALFKRPAVNVHASLLPRWRGAAPIQRSIMAGDKVTGVALQVIVPKLDAGPLLGKREILIDDETTSLDLYGVLKTRAPELLEVEYLEYLRGLREPVAQDESQVTVAQKVTKEEGLIDWRMPAREINQRIRGLWMWPGSWTIRGGKTLKIWKTRVLDGSGAAGSVVQVTPGSFVVACGSGRLEVSEVQPESRARMPVSEYLKGYPLSTGESFG